MHHGNQSKNKELKKVLQNMQYYLLASFPNMKLFERDRCTRMLTHSHTHTGTCVYKHAAADLYSTTWLVESRLDI